MDKNIVDLRKKAASGFFGRLRESLPQASLASGSPVEQGEIFTKVPEFIEDAGATSHAAQLTATQSNPSRARDNAQSGDLDEAAIDAPEERFHLIEWLAHEYEERDYSNAWHIGAASIALIFVLFSIIAHNYLLLALVAATYSVVLMHTLRAPRPISCAIGYEGVRVGRRVYHTADLESFHIFDRPDVRELSLKTKRTMHPYVRVPLGDADPEDIRLAMAEILEQDTHQEFLADHITRILKL